MFETLIVKPMGFIIKLIYDFIPNYGIALILFTILIKLIIFPLNLKSQKSMVKQQKLAPQLAELQKKYANDKEKLNKEMMELYRANGANPASGCLPMLLQFPIIIALFRVIQKPLSYILQIDFSLQANLDKVAQLQSLVAENEVLSGLAQSSFLSSGVETLVKQFQITMAQFASNPLVEGFSDWIINFDFLGLDLSRYPSEASGVLWALLTGRLPANWLELLPLLIIPALAGLTSWLLTKMTKTSQPQPQTDNSSAQADQAAQMAKSMSLMMPVMSVIFTFTLPCGIGLYWTVSNLFQMVQQAITVKILEKKEENIDVVNTIKPNRKDLKKHR